jgi:hypothetical protein
LLPGRKTLASRKRVQGSRRRRNHNLRRRSLSQSPPELVGYENIRDFIACVTYGMANDTITAFRGDRLLAGARLALSAVRQAPTDSEKTKKERPKAAPDQELAPLETAKAFHYPQ